MLIWLLLNRHPDDESYENRNHYNHHEDEIRTLQQECLESVEGNES